MPSSLGAASTNFCGRDIHAEVHDLKAAAFEHRGHQVLANVVQVILNRTDYHPSGRFDTAFGQMRGNQGQ